MDGILTTNWDQYLESIFPEFTRFIGQDEVIFSRTHSIGEIFKIHGCVTKPNSIVLTAEDYDYFMRRSAYLAAKLLTIFVEHPIIFVGYSMSDPNVIQIIKSVSDALDESQIEKLRDRLIFVDWDELEDGSSMERSEFLVDGTPIPIRKIKTRCFKGIYKALASTRRKLSVRMLRSLRESVYGLVRSGEVAPKLNIIGLEQDSHLEDVEFVVGIGLVDRIQPIGLKGVCRDDVVGDLLNDSKSWPAKEMVSVGLPSLLRRAKTTPICKYLAEGGFFKRSGELKSPVDSRISERLNSLPECVRPTRSFMRKARELSNPALSPREFINAHGVEKFLYYYIDNEGLADAKLDDLRQILADIFNEIGDSSTLMQSSFYKMCCYYDMKRYSPWLLRPNEASVTNP